MADRSKKQNNVQEFKQMELGLDLEIDRTVRNIKDKESTFRSETDIYTDNPLPPILPPLLLPRRYEVLEAEAQVR